MNCIINYLPYYNDSVEVNQLSFQDSASPIAEQLIFFHDNVMFLIVIILVLVGWILIASMTNKHYYKYLVEGTAIEIIWTLVPVTTTLTWVLTGITTLLSTSNNLKSPVSKSEVGII